MSADFATMSGAQVRELCRAGQFDRPTAGVARGYAQANLVIVRESVAQEFEQFCLANPKPCPLIEVLEPGQFEPKCAGGADLRTDLPRYRVYRNGEGTSRPQNVLAEWQSAETDGKGRFVAFLIGCSFTFENALLAANIPLRHIEEGRNVPMYRTNFECMPAGPFHGPLVLSMRPLKPEHIELATQITEQSSDAHGTPVHIGDPGSIGIYDIAHPDYGDAVTIHPGEVPVFWACGVTPIEAILRAKLDIAITHEPGHMFISNLD